MPFYLPSGMATDGSPPHLLIRAQAQFQARTALLAATAVVSITDSTGGTADSASNGRRLFKPTAAVGATNTGSNLADKTTTEAALVAVTGGLREIATKANEMATRLGIANMTYNGGGAAPDDTMAAVSASVTGAATGALVANFNAILVAYGNAMLAVSHQVSKIARACGVTPVSTGTAGWVYDFNLATGTVAALSTDTGTAASPGVLKTEADAALGVLRNNLSTLAAVLNACKVQGAPAVIAI